MCYCWQERCLLIWASSVPNTLAHGNDVETMLPGLVSEIAVWSIDLCRPLVAVGESNNGALDNEPISSFEE